MLNPHHALEFDSSSRTQEDDVGLLDRQRNGQAPTKRTRFREPQANGVQTRICDCNTIKHNEGERKSTATLVDLKPNSVTP